MKKQLAVDKLLKSLNEENEEFNEFEGEEDEFNEPNDDDYVIKNYESGSNNDNGVWIIGQHSPFIKFGADVDWENVYKKIAEKMRKDRFYPNVWQEYERGDFSLDDGWLEYAKKHPTFSGGMTIR